MDIIIETGGNIVQPRYHKEFNLPDFQNIQCMAIPQPFHSGENGPKALKEPYLCPNKCPHFPSILVCEQCQKNGRQN